MASVTPYFQLLIFLGLPTSVIVLVIVLRHRTRQRVLAIIREAIFQDKALTPEVLATLAGDSLKPSARDLRRGALLVAFGIGLGLIGACAAFGIEHSRLQGGLATGMVLAGLGAMPLCIGLALILLARAERS